MVLSTAFGEKKPGLDRNMIRVLERVFSISSEKARPHTDRELWAAAEEIMPEKKTKDYNWGVMDLAAEICRPRNPKCKKCPLEVICDYAQSQNNNEN
jgi:A/G-specific adenine glycosylase